MIRSIFYIFVNSHLKFHRGRGSGNYSEKNKDRKLVWEDSSCRSLQDSEPEPEILRRKQHSHRAGRAARSVLDKRILRCYTVHSEGAGRLSFAPEFIAFAAKEAAPQNPLVKDGGRRRTSPRLMSSRLLASRKKNTLLNFPI